MPRPKGYKHSEETKRKISESHKGIGHTPETCEKLRQANLGKKLSPEVCERIRLGHLGLKHSKEWVEKAAAKMRGHTPMHNGAPTIGSNNPNWKGGERVFDGRVYVYRPDHPNANRGCYVRRSHLVVEARLGRFLKPGELVHHDNLDTMDDRDENLVLCRRGEHNKLHNDLRGRDDAGRFRLKG